MGRVEIDERQHPGLTTDAQEWLKALERENRERRRVNEILKPTPALFAAKLDGQQR